MWKRRWCSKIAFKNRRRKGVTVFYSWTFHKKKRYSYVSFNPFLWILDLFFNQNSKHVLRSVVKDMKTNLKKIACWTDIQKCIGHNFWIPRQVLRKPSEYIVLLQIVTRPQAHSALIQSIDLSYLCSRNFESISLLLKLKNIQEVDIELFTNLQQCNNSLLI